MDTQDSLAAICKEPWATIHVMSTARVTKEVTITTKLSLVTLAAEVIVHACTSETTCYSVITPVLIHLHVMQILLTLGVTAARLIVPAATTQLSLVTVYASLRMNACITIPP
jgi:hypothetical protein